MTLHKNTLQKNSGFALLITILVIGVVLSVMLTIVELSLQQLSLSVDSTGSEIAFHAANAGLECARYTRRASSDAFEVAPLTAVVFPCFGTNTTSSIALVSPAANSVAALNPSNTGTVRRYQFSVDWGGTSPRCSEVDMVTMVMSINAASDGTIGAPGVGTTLKNIFPEYAFDTKTCEPGGRCTIVSVTGYNSTCSAKTSPDTLRREILLEF